MKNSRKKILMLLTFMMTVAISSSPIIPSNHLIKGNGTDVKLPVYSTNYDISDPISEDVEIEGDELIPDEDVPL